MLLLSRMVGRDVQGPHHTTVGRLLDLTAALGERGGNPSVTRLLVGRGRKEQLLVPWTSVTFFQHGIQIDGDGTGFAVASVPAALHDGEILLVRDVLDSQIVDIAGQRLARVADVILAHCPGRRVELVGVEVGFGAVLRRLGQRLPAVGRSDVVAWRDLHLISERGHTAQLATPRSAVHLLDARGLAVLISRLDTESATEVLAARGPTVAAQVIRASHPAVGYEAALDDPYREARTFYLTFGLVTVSGAVIILIPNAPLVTILVATQVLNAVLLIPLLFAMIGIGRDADLMGEFRIGRAGAMTYGVTTAVVVACVAALAVVSVWP